MGGRISFDLAAAEENKAHNETGSLDTSNQGRDKGKGQNNENSGPRNTSNKREKGEKGEKGEKEEKGKSGTFFAKTRCKLKSKTHVWKDDQCQEMTKEDCEGEEMKGKWDEDEKKCNLPPGRAACLIKRRHTWRNGVCDDDVARTKSINTCEDFDFCAASTLTPVLMQWIGTIIEIPNPQNPEPKKFVPKEPVLLTDMLFTRICNPNFVGYVRCSCSVVKWVLYLLSVGHIPPDKDITLTCLGQERKEPPADKPKNGGKKPGKEKTVPPAAAAPPGTPTATGTPSATGIPPGTPATPPVAPTGAPTTGTPTGAPATGTPTGAPATGTPAATVPVGTAGPTESSGSPETGWKITSFEQIFAKDGPLKIKITNKGSVNDSIINVSDFAQFGGATDNKKENNKDPCVFISLNMSYKQKWYVYEQIQIKYKEPKSSKNANPNESHVANPNKPHDLPHVAETSKPPQKPKQVATSSKTGHTKLNGQPEHLASATNKAKHATPPKTGGTEQLVPANNKVKQVAHSPAQPSNLFVGMIDQFKPTTSDQAVSLDPWKIWLTSDQASWHLLQTKPIKDFAMDKTVREQQCHELEKKSIEFIKPPEHPHAFYEKPSLMSKLKTTALKIADKVPKKKANAPQAPPGKNAQPKKNAAHNGGQPLAHPTPGALVAIAPHAAPPGAPGAHGVPGAIHGTPGAIHGTPAAPPGAHGTPGALPTKEMFEKEIESLKLAIKSVMYELVTRLHKAHVQGTPGAPGAPGKAHVQGTPGAPAAPGKAHVQGTPHAPAAPGKPGAPATPGKAHVPGTPGDHPS